MRIFLPNSEKRYTQNIYNTKSKNLATVVYNLGRIENANGIAIMGLAEIENKIVLNQLINENIIKKYHYKFIHFDSKDPRGVDVALLYNPALFVPYQYKPYNLSDEKHFNKIATRDILLVKGLLLNKWIYILVNHWPSRRGIGNSSVKKRIWASTVCKRIMDSIEQNDTAAKILVMGDFNDNPNNRSIKLLKMSNPFLKLYRMGLGSIAFNDSWNLFDQILLSPNWLSSKMQSNKYFDLTNYKSIIYKNKDMIEWGGKYRGYPKRTYNGIEFRGGYSDHFPVALIFTVNSAQNPL
jgi:predicted extracellular nuclease